MKPMNTLLGIAHFKLHSDKVEEFKRLSQQCMEIVRAYDTGTLRYDIFLNADESQATVVEEYVDAQALIDHSKHIGEALSAAITATGTVHGEILGELPEHFREGLQDGPVQPFAPYLSYSLREA